MDGYNYWKNLEFRDKPNVIFIQQIFIEYVYYVTNTLGILVNQTDRNTCHYVSYTPEFAGRQ